MLDFIVFIGTIVLGGLFWWVLLWKIPRAFIRGLKEGRNGDSP